MYARALLFLTLGSGALVGAMAVLSSRMVEESVERLLEERLDLARTAGVFLEHQLRSDLDHMADQVRAVIRAADGELDPGPIRSVLAGEYGNLFSEGAFLLDAQGDLVTGVPNDVIDVRNAVDMESLLEQANDTDDIIAAPLVQVGARNVLLLLRSCRTFTGELRGYLGALLNPALTNVLDPLRQVDDRQHAEMDLVDSRGVVVASTERRGLLRRGDHGNLLAIAIRDHENVQGRCHSCHVHESGDAIRNTDVLAFSPLPTLNLGLAVRQPEQEALAPAFALQKQLILLGFAFVALFVVFAGLSVRSVVLPVTRLTDAVHRSEGTQQQLKLGSYGRDEVGQLASALELWRGRMLESLDAAENNRKALYSEMEATRRHLEVLQNVVAQATVDSDLRTIIDNALERSLSLLGLCCGVMGFRHREEEILVFRGMSDNHAGCLLNACRQIFQEEGAPLTRSVSGPYRTDYIDLSDRAGTLCCSETFKTVVSASILGPQGIDITTVLAHQDRREVIEERRLSSLLRHVSLAVAARLLREADLERQSLQRLFLRRVLMAQEGERRRVARDLHDTLAQDLTALRLEIERLSGNPVASDIRDQLEELEPRAHDMLVTVRRILLDLRLSALESMGFVSALQAQLDLVSQRHGIRTTFVVDGEEVEPEYELAVTLFRILQESLANVAQHAQAEHVFVTVAFKPDSIALTVEDDGCGFDPETIHEQRQDGEPIALGLLGMEERASLLGGEMTVNSSPDEGTMIRVSVPLPESAEPETRRP